MFSCLKKKNLNPDFHNCCINSIYIPSNSVRTPLPSQILTNPLCWVHASFPSSLPRNGTGWCFWGLTHDTGLHEMFLSPYPYSQSSFQCINCPKHFIYGKLSVRATSCVQNILFMFYFISKKNLLAFLLHYRTFAKGKQNKTGKKTPKIWTLLLGNSVLLGRKPDTNNGNALWCWVELCLGWFQEGNG